MEASRLIRAPRKPAPVSASYPLLATRLLVSILAEGVATVFHLLLFPFRRAALRQRIRQIILRPTTVWLVVLVWLSHGLAGCRSTAPGSSFSKQVDETMLTVQDLFRMDDAQGSLEDDLRDLGSGTSLAEAWWDFEQLVSSPDAQRSLEEDLQDFGNLELDGLPETFDLLGW